MLPRIPFQLSLRSGRSGNWKNLTFRRDSRHSPHHECSIFSPTCFLSLLPFPRAHGGGIPPLWSPMEWCSSPEGGTYPPFATAAELYDPATGTWMITGSPIAPHRVDATATLLPNGKVLVAGGSEGNDELSSAELYDPSTATWSATGDMTTPRSVHSATVLPDGDVLVAGGFVDSLTITATAEIYHTATGQWTATGSLTDARYSHTATLLPNSTVLVAGGYNGGALASGELYDPVSGNWMATGSLAEARSL